jgi:creatinine amidohydrolase
MTADEIRWGRYSELFPTDLAAIQAAAPLAYLPWGALEWHGPHLPLGMDGITAEHVAERLVQRTGGVLLPTTWWPVTALPHPTSLSVNHKVIRVLLSQIFQGLAASGWRIVVLISGHYAHGHELVLIEAAEAAIKDLGLLVLTLPPMALIDEDMLDHAGLWESSQLMAIRPDLVRLEKLGDGKLDVASSAVLGQDPRGRASASLGERSLSLAVERIARALSELHDSNDPAPLLALYQQRRERYQAYVDRYVRDSYEQAIKDWWAEQTRGESSADPSPELRTREAGR